MLTVCVFSPIINSFLQLLILSAMLEISLWLPFTILIFTDLSVKWKRKKMMTF